MKLRLSPGASGLMHVGEARLALAGWLLARRHNGQVLLRVDAAHAAAIQADLAWLGLDWDACIETESRAERYKAAAQQLEASKRLYPCFESEEELAAKRDQRQRRNQPTLYDRAMLKMTPAQRAAAEAGGKVPYWRFLLSGRMERWTDLAQGAVEVKLAAISDPVVVRADGTPLYAFMAAVDDLDFGITHAVRSADHLGGSALQRDMTEALGGRPDRMKLAHLAPLEAGKRPLPSLRSLRADGIEPMALCAYLATLGTKLPAEPEPPGLLATRFDLARFTRESQHFEAVTLLDVNRRALHAMPFEAVQDRLPPAATPAFWHAVRGSLDLLREARGWWDVVSGSIVPPLLEDEGPFLHLALDTLPPDPWDETVWPRWQDALAEASGREKAALLEPLLLALTGEDHGPDLNDLLPLMGRPRVVERLRLAAT